MGLLSPPPWPLNHNLLTTKAFNTSFNLPSLHWHSTAKGKGKKNNLGTSSIFHEFSFRPEPPVTVVDRSSCCHIFNTWSYSCSPWGLPLTPVDQRQRGDPRLSLPCSCVVLLAEILATLTAANVSPDIPAGKLHHGASIGSTGALLKK